MARNLADAAYEPSDDDLVELSREAFAGVRAANEAALTKVRAEIEFERAAVLARLRARAGAPR